MKYSLSFLCLLLVCCTHCLAQISINLKPSKKDYVAGEPVYMTITIGNHTGAPIELRNRGNMPWLDISINRTEGNEALPQLRFADFPVLKLPSGQQTSKKVDMRHLYELTRASYYNAQAFVRSPDGKNVFASTKALFTIHEGTLEWHQAIVTPEGGQCNYYLRSLVENHKKRLFIQIKDEYSSTVTTAIPVGEWLSFNKPQCKFDSKLSLHVLFQCTPRFYTYVVANTKGQRQSFGHYRVIPGMQPKLVNTPDGGVKVDGAVFVDPNVKPPSTRDATVVPK